MQIVYQFIVLMTFLYEGGTFRVRENTANPEEVDKTIGFNDISPDSLQFQEFNNKFNQASNPFVEIIIEDPEGSVVYEQELDIAKFPLGGGTAQITRHSNPDLVGKSVGYGKDPASDLIDLQTIANETPNGGVVKITIRN